MGNVLGYGNPTHKVSVKTGDRKNSGTDGGVFAKAKDVSGVWTEERALDKWWKNDLERGRTDVYEVEVPTHGPITDICIRRDESGPHDSWFLEKVEVEHIPSGKVSVFPVTRWVNAQDELYLSEFDSSLPQFSAYKEQRAYELEQMRGIYQLYEQVPGLPYLAKKLPEEEKFTDSYKFDLNLTKVEMYAKTKYISFTTPRFTELSDFDSLYRHDILPKPDGQHNWQDEEEFGNQRLNGVSPTQIELCQAIPEGFAVTAEMVQPHLEGKSLDDAMKKKKIYIVDLRYLAGLQIVHIRCKIPGPIGMFYVKDNGHLICVAIQLMPKPAADNPVFLPSDPQFTWQMAKMYFNLADSSHHQSVTHLGFTHLLMETVVLCMHRSISKSHPIYRLIAPHTLFLLAINDLAVNRLVGPDGWVDQVMQIQREGMFEIVAHNWKEWTVQRNGNLRNDLRRRGVDDTEALPNYHYRNDALLLWDAITSYVKMIIDGVYDEPSKLEGDWELQKWAEELNNAKVKGVPEKFKKNEELIELLVVLIYTASVQHAAANFGQYDEYGYPPNYPVKLSGERPKDKTPVNESEVVDRLQSKKETLDIIIVTYLLSQRGTNALGDFELQYAYDPLCLSALEKFQKNLADISKVIQERNEQRLRKYPYLDPKEIPNAISI